MKIRRLSEIDLARIGPLDKEEKLHRLRVLKAGRPPHTYNPLRASLGDILNLQPEMFGSGGEYTPWDQIAADIEKHSTSESETDFNLAVAEALYDFGVEKQVRSYSKPIDPWAVGYGQSVKYWWNLYTVIEKRPCFVFVDPRISNPLTQVGRKFVLSLMHERIRVPDPDFADSRLLVVQFGRADLSKRVIRLFEPTDSGLFGFDELNEMIDETYRLWIEVLEERADEMRRKPTGTTPLGF
jgi:hypothetical protein